MAKIVEFFLYKISPSFVAAEEGYKLIEQYINDEISVIGLNLQNDHPFIDFIEDDLKNVVHVGACIFTQQHCG